ncbi:glycosyltransferase family 9 protein [Asaia astilbis]|uniref:glycosyltransferase family 9 protein n=1 Tax=Asaia astilbis TaxID=610244 RepID=UPI0004726716|nr:glycosyltransferase family 9 protein [Asaia astilbis]
MLDSSENAEAISFGISGREARISSPQTFLNVKSSLSIKIVGGIGDYMIAMRFIADLALASEPFSVDIYCGQPDVVEWVFKSVKCFNTARSEFLFDRTAQHYDASVWLSHAIVIDVPDFASRHLVSAPRLREALLTAVERSKPLKEFAFRRPVPDNQIARLAVRAGCTRMTFSHWIFGIDPTNSQHKLHVERSATSRFGLDAVPYVTIHNGHDRNVVLLGQTSTKFYPRFSEVVCKVRQEFPHIKFLQVGTKDDIRIENTDFDLRGQTSLPEVAGLIDKALCHLDVESGLVHMAHCLETPAVVVFGPTPVDYFGYPDYSAIPPQACGDCWATQDTWMALCPRGHKVPVCTQQSPDLIAQALSARLANMTSSM